MKVNKQQTYRNDESDSQNLRTVCRFKRIARYVGNVDIIFCFSFGLFVLVLKKLFQKYFEELKNATGATNAAELQSAVAAKVSYRHKRLFEMLRERASRAKSIQENNNENNDRKPKRIVVVGAGPVGLRAAVEALLLGWHVTVLEKRTEYSRLNVIKTWSQSVDDLLGFGLKIFAPNISKHGQVISFFFFLFPPILITHITCFSKGKMCFNQNNARNFNESCSFAWS